MSKDGFTAEAQRETERDDGETKFSTRRTRRNTEGSGSWQEIGSCGRASRVCGAGLRPWNGLLQGKLWFEDQRQTIRQRCAVLNHSRVGALSHNTNAAPSRIHKQELC